MGQKRKAMRRAVDEQRWRCSVPWCSRRSLVLALRRQMTAVQP